MFMRRMQAIGTEILIKQRKKKRNKTRSKQQSTKFVILTFRKLSKAYGLKKVQVSRWHLKEKADPISIFRQINAIKSHMAVNYA